MSINIVPEKLSIDQVGVVFEYNDKFYRAIKKDAEKDVAELLETELIDELIERNLFPKTCVADIDSAEYNLILEHDKIKYVTYPFEWSFSMLKDAAICILEVVEVCNKYGYELHDLHNYNVVFRGSNPLFVDFGSIKKGNSFVSRVSEFINYNYLPLKLYSVGESTFAKRILSDDYMVRYLPTVEYHNSSLMRKLLWDLYSDNYKNQVKRILIFLGCKYQFKFNHITPQVLKDKISLLEKKISDSTWGNYHEAYQQNGNLKISKRFNRIIGIVNDLGVSEVLDIAGNQGLLTNLLMESCKHVKDTVCVDYDENAIDFIYSSSKRSKYSSHIYAVNSNLMFPISLSHFAPFSKRMKSDLVLVLALTHHLILTQNFPIDSIFKQVHELTRKYALIEFMPLGLWGGGELPTIPDWYNVDWFRINLLNYFSIILEEKLEDNRILFVGKIINKE